MHTLRATLWWVKRSPACLQMVFDLSLSHHRAVQKYQPRNLKLWKLAGWCCEQAEESGQTSAPGGLPGSPSCSLLWEQPQAALSVCWRAGKSWKGWFLQGCTAGCPSQATLKGCHKQDKSFLPVLAYEIWADKNSLGNDCQIRLKANQGRWWVIPPVDKLLNAESIHLLGWATFESWLGEKDPWPYPASQQFFSSRDWSRVLCEAHRVSCAKHHSLPGVIKHVLVLREN